MRGAPSPSREHASEREHVARAEEVIDLGQLLGELGRDSAATGSRRRPGCLQRRAASCRPAEDGVDRLLFGALDEAAGVDDDDLGRRRVVDQAVAGLVADTEHDLGIDSVFRAAERNEVNRLRRFFRPWHARRVGCALPAVKSRARRSSCGLCTRRQPMLAQEAVQMPAREPGVPRRLRDVAVGSSTGRSGTGAPSGRRADPWRL